MMLEPFTRCGFLAAMIRIGLKLIQKSIISLVRLYAKWRRFIGSMESAFRGAYESTKVDVF